MKVSRWEVTNYKSIESGSFDLGDFTAIIGKNNSGKSNIINSLKDFQNNHNNQSHHTGISESLITERATGKSEDTGFEVLIEIELSETCRKEIIKSIKKSKESTRRPPAEPPSPGEMHDRNWLSEVKFRVKYHPDSSVKTERTINYGGEFVSVDELVGSREVYGANFRSQLNDNLEQFIDSWRFVDPFREPRDVQKGTLNIELEPTGKSLIQVLDSLGKNYRDIFAKVAESYIEIMEGVSDLRIEYDPEGPNANSVTAIVEEEKYDTKFKSEDISSGSKEILVLLTQVFLAERFSNLLVIEEPELHVHPEAQNKIYSILERVIEEGGPQIIVSTHSDVFVNQSDVSNIVRVERDGDTKLRTIGEGDINHELADLGYNKSGLLQSEAVVFVEGRSDKRILKMLGKNIGLDFDNQGISLVELEGIENMKRDGKSLVKLLYSFDIPYLFLCDSHNEPREKVQGNLFEAMKRKNDDHWWEVSIENIYVWEGYGIESYLLAPRAISSSIELTQEEIAHIINSNEGIDDKEKVLKRIYDKEYSEIEGSEDIYSKDKHGMEIARNMENDEIPEEVIDVMTKIGSLVPGWGKDELSTK